MGVFITSNNTDRQHIQALARCKQPGNNGLIELFTLRLQETYEALSVATEPRRIYVLQGRAETLKDFIESVEEVRGNLD